MTDLQNGTHASYWSGRLGCNAENPFGWQCLGEHLSFWIYRYARFSTPLVALLVKEKQVLIWLCLPFLDLPICPSLGARWPSLCGLATTPCPLRATWECPGLYWPAALGCRGPFAGINSGILDTPYISATLSLCFVVMSTRCPQNVLFYGSIVFTSAVPINDKLWIVEAETTEISTNALGAIKNKLLGMTTNWLSIIQTWMLLLGFIACYERNVERTNEHLHNSYIGY